MTSHFAMPTVSVSASGQLQRSFPSPGGASESVLLSPAAKRDRPSSPAPAIPSPDSAAMQDLYRQVQSIYRNVKEAGVRADADRAEPSTMQEGTTTNAAAAAATSVKTQGRGRSPVPTTAAERRPWGYNSPARQPSSGGAPRTVTKRTVTPLGDGSGEADHNSGGPKSQRPPLPRGPSSGAGRTTPRGATPTEDASGARSRSSSAPRSGRSSSSTGPAAKPATTTGRKTPTHFDATLPRVASMVMPSQKLNVESPRTETAVHRGPSAKRASSMAQKAAAPVAAPGVSQEAFDAMAKRVDQLEAALKESLDSRSMLEDRVQRAEEQVESHRRATALTMEEHHTQLHTLGSQVQFAIAWIQQVDRHVNSNEQQPTGRQSPQVATVRTGRTPTRSPPQRNAPYHSDEPVSRRLEMNDSRGAAPNSVHRLPPSPPISLTHMM